MASSLSNLVNKRSERIHTIKCKFILDDKKCDTCGSFATFTDDLIQCKCLCCNKNYQQNFEKKLKELFFNTCKYPNRDNNKFIFCCEKVFILMNI